MTAMMFHCRGSQARLKAQNRLIGGAVASGACRVGVRGFESHPLHCGTHPTYVRELFFR
jgi:hypothetical protein